jgi:peptide/nickel transport system substrate-binding protein
LFANRFSSRTSDAKSTKAGTSRTESRKPVARSRGLVLIAALAALAATAVLTACGSSGGSGSGTGASGSSGTSQSAGPPQKGGELAIGLAADPQNMDPLVAVDNIAVGIWESWWQYLVKPSPDGKSIEPQLATKWTVSPDDKRYVFTLRRGVKFSNGEPLTAADVVGSVERAMTVPTSQATYMKEFVASVTAPSKYTVVFKLSKPWHYLVEELSSGNPTAIMPQKLIEKEGYEKYLEEPIGTGPFIFEHWQRGSDILVKRNPNYWEKGLPYLDSIDFKVLPTESTRVAAVLSNQVDVAEQPPRSQLSSLEGHAGVVVETLPSSRSDLVVLNTEDPPLQEAAVRQAISLAIERKGLTNAALFGTGKPQTTFITPPPSLTFANESLNLYPYDPEKAEALLKEAGVKNLSLELEVATGSDQAAIAQVMQSDLEKVGISLKIVTKDPTTWLDDLYHKRFQMITTYWSNIFPDPTAQVLYTTDPSYCCEAYWSGLKDPELIKAARDATSATGSHAELQKLYDKVQVLDARAMNIIPLYASNSVLLRDENVNNLVYTTFGIFYFEKTWLGG